jgi:hypothetical protein
MSDWMFSLLILSLSIFLTSRASLFIEHWVGRSSANPNLPYYASLALGTGLTVYAINAAVELPLSYMTCIAGLAGNFASLLAQCLFGKAISD